MKRQIVSFATLAIVLLLTTVYACNKTAQQKEAAATGGAVAKNIAPCDGHGGSTGHGGVSWNVATRRSGCERGIGFRCGHYFYAYCNDGVIVKWHDGVPAPNYPRPGKAKYIFLNRDQLELTFEELPDDTDHDDFFDVEDDVLEETPDWFEVGGRHYSLLTIKAGSYPIDRSINKLGTVLLDIELQP